MRRNIARICLSTVALAASMPALAQETTATSNDQQGGVQDIVVTAQRREERLQNVPIAVTAFTPKTLAVSGITNTQGLAIATPGLQMVQNGLAASPYLRGVGAESASIGGVEAPVATYIDGVYYPENAANIFAFNNVARVEVLKGPQGTLFGRNSTGGLISITTRDPSVNASAEGNISYGNYHTVEGTFYATGGKGNLAGDLAVYGIHNDGYGENLVNGRPASVERTISARSKIKWTPGDSDTFTITADYTRDRGTVGLGQRVPNGRVGVDGVVATGNDYDLQSDLGPIKRINSYTIAAKYVHDFDWGSFSSLTAYRNSHIHYIWDVDGTPLPILPVDVRLTSSSLQQELLLNGKAGRLTWTAGIFLYEAKADEVLIIQGSLIPGANYTLPAEQTTHSYAGFAQGTYAISDNTNVTAGFRYTIDERHIDGQMIALAGNTVPAGTVLDTLIANKTFRSPSWKLSVDHRFSPEVMVYASYDRGFKSGTFNVGALNQPAVNPEKLDAFEIGAKTDLFNRMLRINVAGFYYNYRGIQLGSDDNKGNALILNAATAHEKGLEIESTFVPPIDFGHLQFNAGLALLDAHYANFPNGPINTPQPGGGNVQTFGDLSGNDMAHAPKWTLTLGGTFETKVGEGDLTLGVTYFHSGKYFWDSENRFTQKAYDLLNSTITYSFGRENRYSVSVYGKNLTNTHYYANVLFGAGDVVSYAPPRRYGVTLGFKI